MIYRNNTQRFLVPALLLALVVFGISPFTSGASAPPAALTVPSSVAGWGNNFSGQLSIPAGLNDATAIASGFSHILALKSDGTVVGWGSNDLGEATPPAGLNHVVAIAANSFLFSSVTSLSAALQEDGTVVTWGFLGEQSFPGNAKAIAAGGFHILALQDDGTVVGFGNDFLGLGVLNIPAGLNSVKAVSAGTAHSLALKTDGTVVAWGTDLSGTGVLNVPAGLSGVTAISAGPFHNLALKSDGTVVAWGADVFGTGVLNVPAGLNHVTAISAGLFHNLALKDDGTVVGWGDNRDCESIPPSCITGARAIAVGVGYSLTLQAQSCVQIGCSPQQDLSGIIAQIQALVAAGTLTQNQGAGLIDKINQTIVKLDSGQTGAACNQLNAFINQVNAFIRDHSLTPSQGQTLIDGANSIKADIGCP